MQSSFTMEFTINGKPTDCTFSFDTDGETVLVTAGHNKYHMQRDNEAVWRFVESDIPTDLKDYEVGISDSIMEHEI